MFSLLAPAKLDLSLEVLGELPDDCHEIKTVLQVVSLGDRLSFELGRKIRVECDSPYFNLDFPYQKVLISGNHGKMA